MQVCVLIPSYNEFQNLNQLIPVLYEKVYIQLPKAVFSTLVVDDDSWDDTRDLLVNFQKKYSGVYVSLGEKLGIGKALKRGYRFAMTNLRAEIILTIEADMVVKPLELVPMLKLIGTHDVVLASRKNTVKYYRGNWGRYLGHELVNRVICSWLSGMTEISEHTAATRAIRVKGVLDAVDLEPLPDGYAFFPAVLFELAKKTDKIVEYKTLFYKRKMGESKMEFFNLAAELRDVTRVSMKYRMGR